MNYDEARQLIQTLDKIGLELERIRRLKAIGLMQGIHASSPIWDFVDEMAELTFHKELNLNSQKNKLNGEKEV